MFYISLLSPHSSLLFLILHYYLSSLNVVEFCVYFTFYFYFYISVQYHKPAQLYNNNEHTKNYASVHYNAKT